MLTTLNWFTLIVFLVGMLTLIAVVSPDRRIWKVLALGLTTLFLPMSYLAANDLLSRPKPFKQELLQTQLDEAIVLSSVIRDGEDIFLWLKINGLEEPRSYRLPWSEDTAVQLHKAQQQSEEEGTQTKLKLPDTDMDDSSIAMFEVVEREQLPSKSE